MTMNLTVLAAQERMDRGAHLIHNHSHHLQNLLSHPGRQEFYFKFIYIVLKDLFCLHVCAYMCVGMHVGRGICHIYVQVPEESRRGHQNLWR